MGFCCNENYFFFSKQVMWKIKMKQRKFVNEKKVKEFIYKEKVINF